MKREFLQNLKIGDQPLSKEVIDAVMEENGRDIEAAKKPFADYDTVKQQLTAPTKPWARSNRKTKRKRRKKAGRFAPIRSFHGVSE